MCDRMRDNTHCHSFAHDFHLRAVHRYIKGCKDNSHHPSKEFHNTYHLVNMLKDFALFYEEAPRFSRNALALSKFLSYMSVCVSYGKGVNYLYVHSRALSELNLAQV